MIIAITRKHRDTSTYTTHRKVHGLTAVLGMELNEFLIHISLLLFGAMNWCFVFGFLNYATYSDYSRSPTMNTFLKLNTLKMVFLSNGVDGCLYTNHFHDIRWAKIACYIPRLVYF